MKVESAVTRVAADFLNFGVWILEKMLDKEAILVKLPGIASIGHVANSCHTVIGECYSAGRLYDKIGDTDDYSKNLFEWESKGKDFLGIKFDNGINCNAGKWRKHGGIVMSKDMSPGEMYWMMRVVVESMRVA